MANPQFNINIENSFRTLVTNADNIVGIIATASNVTVGTETTFSIGTTNQIINIDDLEDRLGVTEDNNPTLWKAVRDFYSNSGGDAGLYIRGTALDTLDAICDPTSDNGVKDFIDDRNGELKAVMVARSYPDGYGIASSDNYVAPVNGIDADFGTAWDKFQSTLLTAEGNQRGCVGLLPCVYVDPENLDATNSPINQSNFLVSAHILSDSYDETKGVNNLVTGVALARIYRTRVSQTIQDRSLFGAVLGVNNYYVGRGVKSTGNDLASINLNTAGFIGGYKFPGDGGFYINDDTTSIAVNNSRGTINANRVLHKAARVIIEAVKNYIGGNYSIGEGGTLNQSMISSIENAGNEALRLNLSDDTSEFSFRVSDTSTFSSNGAITCQITIKAKNSLKSITFNISLTF